MMKRTLTLTAAIGAATIFSFTLLAQQPQQKPQQQQQGHMMSMDDMMKGCREHCQATTASIDKTLSSIAEAKKTKDPAKMRAALDQVEKPLAEMKSHMSMCMNMMNMMNMMKPMEGAKPPAR